MLEWQTLIPPWQGMFGSGSIIVWGCLSAYGTGRLSFNEVRMNREKQNQSYFLHAVDISRLSLPTNAIQMLQSIK